MRKSAISAAAVFASVSLLSVGAPTVAQAETAKELNVCWTNNAEGTTDLEFVADGPAYRTFSLDNGDCVAWDVKPGQYKMTVEDVSEFIENVTKECEDFAGVGFAGPGTIDNWQDLDGDGVFDAGEEMDNPRGSVKITRQGDSYKAWPLGALINGEITTNVRKDRRTSISVLYYCAATPETFGGLLGP